MLAVEQENAAAPLHPVRWLVLNTEANVEIDITATDGLRDLCDALAERGGRLGLARVKTDLRIELEQADLRRAHRRGHALPHPARHGGGLPRVGRQTGNPYPTAAAGLGDGEQRA